MNLTLVTSSDDGTAVHRVEFFRLPAPGKRDPHFGLSRGWYYKAAAAGEIKTVAIRNRGAVRGVRLVAYDSVLDYIRRCMEVVNTKPRNEPTPHTADNQLALFALPNACATPCVDQCGVNLPRRESRASSNPVH